MTGAVLSCRTPQLHRNCGRVHTGLSKADALLCARHPVDDRWRGSPRPVPANTESSSKLPRQAPLLVLLMDAGPRGLGCQTAWVSFQATDGYFFGSSGIVVKRVAWCQGEVDGTVWQRAGARLDVHHDSREAGWQCRA